MKKVINVKRKLTSLENVKVKAKEQKELTFEVVWFPCRRRRSSKMGKLESLSLINWSKIICGTCTLIQVCASSLRYNKKIVMTLMNHKIEEESKSFKEKLGVLVSLGSNWQSWVKFNVKTWRNKTLTRPIGFAWIICRRTRRGNSTSSINCSSSSSSKSRSSRKNFDNVKGRRWWSVSSRRKRESCSKD